MGVRAAGQGGQTATGKQEYRPGYSPAAQSKAAVSGIHRLPNYEAAPSQGWGPPTS